MVPVLALTLLFAVGAQASEGHDAPRWGDFGWRVLNFIIFAGILWYFVGGLARKFFSGRRARISLGGSEGREAHLYAFFAAQDGSAYSPSCYAHLREEGSL